MTKAVIIAYSSREYREYLRGNRLNRDEYPLVTRAQQILGYRDIPAIRIGRWYMIEGIRDMEQYADAHNIDIIDSNL